MDIPSSLKELSSYLECNYNLTVLDNLYMVREAIDVIYKIQNFSVKDKLTLM